MARRQLPHRNERSSTFGAARAGIARQRLAAAFVATVAFICYYATLLPGLDLGDSASFQAGAGFLTLSPRQAYPLYYGLGGLFVLLHPGEPARALNLASATCGALATGLATWLGARLAESLFAGLAAGLLLAFSYTFWSQAVTAEVYTLHLLIVGAAMLALLAWADEPTAGRLAWFYAIYALGFGNHLSMVLLLPGFAIFLLVHRRPGPSDPLRPRMVAMAVAIALGGALQYAWNLRGMWAELEPPASLAEALDKFWFDVTKADWRETLVMNVSQAGLDTRPSMYWFDVRQQFGTPGVTLAVAGLAYVAIRWPRRAILLALLYGATMAFAWTYNVGDAYIFFLPSHYIVALCAGAGVAACVAWLSRWSTPQVATAAGVAILIYPAWRGYDTFPAVDRSDDHRAVALLHAFTRTDRAAVFGVDSNWQVQNAFEYFMREHRPGVPWFATDQLVWMTWPGARDRFLEFVAANAQAGRDVIVTPRLHAKILAWRGMAWRDRPPEVTSFADELRSIRGGTPYVLAILRPDGEFPLNPASFAEGWKMLSTGIAEPQLRQYNVIAGRVGERPRLVESSDRPFRVGLRIDPFEVDIRMESWLPTDTIRRAGFGHVVVDRRHELTIERGISFRALGPDGVTLYESGIFAPIPRLAVGAAP